MSSSASVARAHGVDFGGELHRIHPLGEGVSHRLQRGFLGFQLGLDLCDASLQPRRLAAQILPVRQQKHRDDGDQRQRDHRRAAFLPNLSRE